MRKLIVIPVLLFYLMAVSGVMIHAHYCGEMLASWSVYLQGDGCEDGGCDDEEDQPDSCCKNEVIASKISADQQMVEGFKWKSQDYFAILPVPQTTYTQQLDAVSLAILRTNQPNAPPGLWQQIPLYKLHLSLTYYG